MIHPLKTDARKETYSYNMYVANGTEANTIGGFRNLIDAKADAIKEGVAHLISGVDANNVDRFTSYINDETVIIHLQKITVFDDGVHEDTEEIEDLDTFKVSLNINSIK